MGRLGRRPGRRQSARAADTAPGTSLPAAARRRWSGRGATRGRPAARRTPDAWRSTGRPSSRRPPSGQRAARLQLVHLRVEQFVLHQQLTDLGLQPTIVFVPGIRRPALQAGLARGQKLITPLRNPRRRDPQLPRHGLEILSAQQTQHRFALAPGRKPSPTAAPGGRSGRPPGSRRRRRPELSPRFESQSWVDRRIVKRIVKLLRCNVLASCLHFKISPTTARNGGRFDPTDCCTGRRP